MNFKAYDILTSLIPGFLILLMLLSFFSIKYDKDWVIAYTAIAFFIGYVLNFISSWLEGLLFFTWGGKPSNKLIDGKNIWKIKFYQNAEAKKLLCTDTDNQNPSNDELFSIAMQANLKESRVEDFLAQYVFSRSIFTTSLLGFLVMLKNQYSDWTFYGLSFLIIFILWLNCKQRGYYYAKEVLSVYLKEKKSQISLAKESV